MRLDSMNKMMLCVSSLLMLTCIVTTVEAADVESIITPTLEPPAESHLQCYFCSQQTREDCDRLRVTTSCEVGEVCRTVVHNLSPFFGGDVTSFQLDCISKSMCNESDACNSEFGGDCIRCCDTNLCNNGSRDIGIATTEPTEGTQLLYRIQDEPHLICSYVFACFD
ncbi:uncharacterized protein LOC134189136 [Corticium candelabrum]|uniref:uncharacterized protein LOC134189136 n=1 Tax=Corticium candelabrum TaxID=121492 RepID=UPI002E262B84|nr:uncharacterized protein LOC134189136 [Corticium candelabrum]